jgi:hypothetical protein
MMIDFPKAEPVERGCGEREQGGVYAECGLSPYGSPLEHFLIDPPQPLPEGLDIINKPQLWEDPATGITHLLIWIGGEHYEWCSDYIEETRLTTHQPQPGPLTAHARELYDPDAPTSYQYPVARTDTAPGVPEAHPPA